MESRSTLNANYALKLEKPKPLTFFTEENVIVEVKTLHQSDEIRKGSKTLEFFQVNEAKRVKARILDELKKYWGTEVNYPIVLILCNDTINPTILSTDDLETVLLFRIDRGLYTRNGFHFVDDMNYEGLYFADNGLQASILSGVGLWNKRLLCFYENPNVSKESNIPQGQLLSFLKIN